VNYSVFECVKNSKKFFTNISVISGKLLLDFINSACCLLVNFIIVPKYVKNW